jgi:mRNA interferase MazF
VAQISQSEVYWLDLAPPRGSEPGYRWPVVVVQNDRANASAIRTIVVCPLTTNLRLADAPGNVLLENGEANLPVQSVVNVSQVVAVDRSYFGEPIGQLEPFRVLEILRGMFLLLRP